MSQHEYEDKSTIKVQTLPTGSRYDGEVVVLSILNRSRYEQAQVDENEGGKEANENVVVLQVHLREEAVAHRLPYLLLRFHGCRNQPPIDADADVLQQATVLFQLTLKRLVSDLAFIIGIRILEHGDCEILNLLVTELHAVLVHTSADDVLQLLVLYQTVTIDVVDFEQEFYFIFRGLTSELVNGIDKLLQGNRAGIVFVEDLEDAFAEEGLRGR